MIPIQSNPRRAMVLLIVLGMLALFSLLTVTYVVFASNSRSSSVALSRRYSYQSSQDEQAQFLFDEAIRQLIRGTTNTESELYGHSMLEDLYGANETMSLGTIPIRSASMTFTAGNVERPMLINNRFLRIPVPNSLPAENDVLNGRILTFPHGQGPLGGLSFHIVRYIGGIDTSGEGSNHTITIDLQENDLTRVHTQLVGTGGAPVSLTGTLAEWALRTPNGQSWAAGVYLCFGTVNTATTELLDPYSFIINAVPLNGHGMGVLADGSSQIHQLVPGANPAILDPGINQVPSGLLLSARELGDLTNPSNPSRLLDPNLSNSPLAASLTRQLQWGDTDEPIDAADFNTAFLAFRPSAAQNSGDIIPSFHRTALLNYLVNFKPIEFYTELEFWAVLRRIELATLRPLSLNIRTPSGVPPFMNSSSTTEYVTHPDFNPTVGGIPPLVINISGSWAGSWNPAGADQFKSWLDKLMTGVWDVDNLSSGKPDSLFIDIGLPPENFNGTILKTLVAYYVECLDGKLDVNAAGGTAQANLYPGHLFALPTAYSAFDTPGAETAFARGNGGTTGSIYLNQGLGYGPADISLRHLMGKPVLSWSANPLLAEMAYRNLMGERYAFASTPLAPGATGHDAMSILNLRENREIHQHGALPGLPKGIRGRVSYALDRLGNPFIHNETTGITLNENEYEARLISGAYLDAPFTTAEWERIYRVQDFDRTGLPDRLQQVMGETDVSISASSLPHEITARSRSLRVPKLSARHLNYKVGVTDYPSPPTSFFELVNTIRQLKSLNVLTFDQFRTFFPIEFHRGQAMNLNRPFGNGIDDNSNGQIDEPTEVAAGQLPLDITGTTSVGVITPVPLDYSAGQAITHLELDPASGGFTGNQPRQLFARHLYCLAQLLVPAEYNFPSIDRAYWQDLTREARAGNVAARQKYIQTRSRILAQWAVNVVDYRDADSTMTRFPYDPDPFDTFEWINPATNTLEISSAAGIGWFPSRGLTDTFSLTAPSHNPDMYVVWGMEQPELLLTESLAFHDTRVRKDPTASSPDRYDQFRIPQGSLFLELYNPRTTETGAAAGNSTQLPGVSPSLYTTAAGGDIALDLSKLSPADGSGNTFPVWRIYLSGSIDKTASGMTQTHKTPNERLISSKLIPSDPNNREKPIRGDLSYQLPVANRVYDASYDTTTGSPAPSVNFNGLSYDTPLLPAERIRCLPGNTSPEVDPTQARVILFTSGYTSTTTSNPTPGIINPAAQVFYNRNGSNIHLRGNQYMVIGPRDVTYLGSKEESRTRDGGNPGNSPSDHRIFLDNSWARMFNVGNTQFRTHVTTAPFNNVREAVTMIAAANRPTTWSPSPNPLNVVNIGINVSEPLPNASYYPEPTIRVNSNNNPNNGFQNINADGYFDYGTGGTAPPRPPFDNGTAGPLRNWNTHEDGAGNLLTTDKIGSGSTEVDIVYPGTAMDWSTAYLQRLADPNQAWNANFNPYITVDWIPIDLTVFNGEDLDSIFTSGSPSETRLASRQKSGQMVNPADLSFDHSSQSGLTFLSPVTHAPRRTTASTSSGPTEPFMRHQIKGETNDTLHGSDARPSTCDTNFLANDSQSFATLGFLNSTYVLAAESTIANIAALPPVYVGAPGDPAKVNRTWHPASIFWADRTFVNGFEIAYVPVSAPGQLGQEFSATDTTKLFASMFHKPTSSTIPYPKDPRMPTAIHSPATGVMSTEWTSGNMEPHWLQNSDPGAIDGEVDTAAYYPFTHLLNFFQEPPELGLAEQRYRIMGGLPQHKQRHPKDTSLSLLFDLIDTPSAWADVENHELSTTFQFIPAPGINGVDQVINARNRIFGPFRAPYNQLPRDVEPGRVALNMISEQNVLQGLWSNVLRPGDVAPSIDHNQNGDADSGQREAPITAPWDQWGRFVRSRQGYDPVAGFYAPPNSVLPPPFNSVLPLDPDRPIRSFNPQYPSHFAGLFKPAGEAGMVPQTSGRFNPTLPTSPRNPFTGGTYPPTNVVQSANWTNHLHADQYGMLDFHARLNPVQATLLRSISEAPNSFGVHVPTTATLFNETGNSNRHPFTDLYPISRLQKLVTERSNVFAVYTTLALFEYNDTSGNIGREYGTDTGEVRRFKAFYLIDRSIPVGFRVGEDHNIENTILTRRILSE